MIAQRAVRGTAFILMGSYTNMAMGMLYTIVMARLLTPEHFGTISLGLFFFSLLDLRGKLGLDFALVHRHPTTPDLLSTHLLLQMLAWLITVLLAIVVAILFSILDKNPTVTWIILALATAYGLEATGSTARIALEKELIFAQSTLVISVSLFVSYCGGILMALAGWTYWALVGQIALNNGIACAGFWWIFLRSSTRSLWQWQFSREIADWMLRYGGVLFIGALATTILLQFDNFIIGTLVGTTALGYYSLAYKIAQWPTGLVTHIVSRTALPTYALLQNDPTRLAKAFQMSLWVILSVAIPIALVIFVIAPDFLLVLYGEQWLPSATLLRVLIFYSVLRPLFDDTGGLFIAIGKPYWLTTTLLVQAITLITIAIPLTWVFQAYGTALAVGITFSFGLIIIYRYLVRIIKLDIWQTFAPPIFASLGALSIYLAFTTIVKLDPIIPAARIVLKSGIVVVSFLAILFLTERKALIGRICYIRSLLFKGHHE